MEAEGIEVSESSVVMVPENTVELTSKGDARRVLRFVEAIEDCDDVQEVYVNFELADDLMEELAAE